MFIAISGTFRETPESPTVRRAEAQCPAGAVAAAGPCAGCSPRWGNRLRRPALAPGGDGEAGVEPGPALRWAACGRVSGNPPGGGGGRDVQRNLRPKAMAGRHGGRPNQPPALQTRALDALRDPLQGQGRCVQLPRLLRSWTTAVVPPGTPGSWGASCGPGGLPVLDPCSSPRASLMARPAPPPPDDGLRGSAAGAPQGGA